MLKAVIFDFDDFVFGSEGKRGKPYPDIFLKACEKLNEKPYEAVVLEDSEAGIQAASDAHIPVVCIPDLKYPSDDYTSKTAGSIWNLPLYVSLKIVPATSFGKQNVLKTPTSHVPAV